jgi:hypothetical protein
MTTLMGAREDDLVLAVLENAGTRGASHEDFVEAGLARDYIAGLRTLVEERGLDIRTDFATGTARWVLSAPAPVHDRDAA